MPLCIRPARVGCLPSAARMITAVDYTRTSGVFLFFGLGFCPFSFLCCTYVPRVCRVIPCPILLVRASCIACHGSTAQQQSAFTLEYIVPYCRCVRDVPTLKMRVVLFLVCIKNSTISSKNDHCCILVQVACFFWGGWDLALFFFKQKTAYEIMPSLVGSEMCIRDRVEESR